MTKGILLVVLIMVIILMLVFTYSWCKISSEQSRLEEIDINFDGYKYCDDDCYMCDLQIKCQKSAIKDQK